MFKLQQSRKDILPQGSKPTTNFVSNLNKKSKILTTILLYEISIQFCIGLWNYILVNETNFIIIKPHMPSHMTLNETSKYLYQTTLAMVSFGLFSLLLDLYFIFFSHKKSIFFRRLDLATTLLHRCRFENFFKTL